MDVLTDLLVRTRATGTTFAVSSLRGPWGLELDGQLPVTIHVALEGVTWVTVEGCEPVALEPGDLALVGPRAHRVASTPDAPCRTLADMQRHRVPGTLATFDVPGSGSATKLLCGGYHFEGGLCDQLLAHVPALTIVRSGDHGALTPLVAVLAAETAGARPGRAVVLDRLFDVMFVDMVRTWFEQAGDDAPPWYRALDDPDVSRALGVVHDDPGRAWTVASWAKTIGVSRPTLARRFQAAMGMAPMTYLADWRMRLAAERLRDTDDAIGRIARDLGYRSDAAFSAAFRRRFGTSPTMFRAGSAPTAA